eukprot:IDg19627t1
MEPVSLLTKPAPVCARQWNLYHKNGRAHLRDKQTSRMSLPYTQQDLRTPLEASSIFNNFLEYILADSVSKMNAIPRHPNATSSHEKLHEKNQSSQLTRLLACRAFP